MNRSKLLSLAHLYRENLITLGIAPARMSNVTMRIDPANEQHRNVLLSHALWACEQIQTDIDRLGGSYRCIRSLGCIQGVLTACGLLSVADAREAVEDLGFGSSEGA